MGKGQWSDWASCPKGEAIKSFRIKIQSPQGKKKDDTAANEVEFKCGDGTILNPTVPKAGRWGTWRTGQSCEKSGRVDRFWVYIEHEQGKKDDTGINGLGVGCKAFSRSKKTSLVCPKGSTLEGEKCRSATVKTSVFKAKCGRNGQCSCGITSFGPGKFRVNCFSSSCPSGWKKRTISLRKGGGKKKKKTVCSRKVSFRGADRCISTGFNEKTKSSRAQFHWRHECNHWISTADDAIYTFPGDG